MKNLTHLKQLVSSHADLAASVALVLLALLAFHPALNTGLVLVDDHELIRFASPTPVHPQAAPAPPSAISTILNDLQNVGRLRPIYYLVRFQQSRIFGTNPLAWHSCVLFLGILTTLLLYRTARIIRMAQLPAFAIAALFLYAPSAAYAWIRIGPAESIGTFFAGLALFSLAQSVNRDSSRWWDIVLVVCATTAAFTKESFILILPAILYARIALWQIIQQQDWRDSIRSNLGVSIALGLVFAGGLILATIAAKMGGAQSYGGSSLSLSMDYFVRLGKSVLGTILESGFLVPVILLCFATRRNNSFLREGALAFHGLVFCGLWVAPQLLLYSTRGGISGFYWLPAAIGLAIANALALRELYRQQSKLYSLALIWLVVWLPVAGAQVYARASKIRADSVALNQMLDYLTTNVGTGKVIVIAANPIENFEYTLSLVYHIGDRHRKDIQVALLSIRNTLPRNPNESSLINDLEKAFSDHNALKTPAAQVDAIILLSPLASLPETWYAQYTTSARRIEFSENAFAPGIGANGIYLFSPQKYNVLWIQH